MGGLFLAVMSLGQGVQPEANPAVLVHKAVERLWADENLTDQFTYSESWHNQNFDQRGRMIVDQTAAFEVISLQGKSYLRMTEKDGKHLSASEEAAEEQHLDSSIKARKGLNMDDRLAALTSNEVGFHLDLQLLQSSFHCVDLGSEVVNGHSTFHLDCLPLKDIKPRGNHDAKNIHVQAWIDKQDHAFVRVDEGLQKGRDGILPGASLSLNWAPFDGVWLPIQVSETGQARLKGNLIRFDTRFLYCNYKRFKTEMHILNNSEAVAIH